MGWALTSAGAPVIPIQPKTYIVTDNQADTWQLQGYLDSGNWQVSAYNTGFYPHTVYLTFQLDLPGTVETPVPPPTGTGVGVVGTGGSVDTGGSTQPPPSGQPPTPSDSVAAAISAVLSAALEQMTAAGA